MQYQQQEFSERSPQTPRQTTKASRKWWYSPFIGYPMAVIFTALPFSIPWLGRSLGVQDYFIEPPFVVSTMIVAWIWGIGPALLAVLLETSALDYWVVPPTGQIDFFLWPDLLSFLPFIVFQLLVIGLVVLQKRYRLQLEHAHYVVSGYVEELAQKNDALKESNQALVQSNAKLDEANRVKDQFLSQASHELKTPITTIQGQAQLALHRLARQKILPENMAFLREHLEKVEAQTHRLTQLVNDLLNLSSLRSGKLPLRLVDCDLCALCREIVRDQSTLHQRPICLRVPSAPIVLQADEGRLSQVILNLVINAIKYSPADSEIEVTVIQQSDQAIVKVHNRGPAISPKHLDHLFTPFFRTPEAKTSASQGWGLGLAISKEIVEQHGGSIQVESSEEHGTTFWISLPVSNAASSLTAS